MAKTVVGIFDERARAIGAVARLVHAGIDRATISVLHGSENREETVGSNLAPDDRFAAPVTTVTPDWGMASAGEVDAAGSARVIDADPDPGTDTALAGDRIGSGPGAAAGAGTGAIIGAGAGLLTGAIGLIIPGLGPILGVGPIAATILGGAGIGAVAGGVAGGLINSGVPEGDAASYVEGLRRGGTLVTVTTADAAHAEAAADLLEDAGAYDIDERAATWGELSEAMTAGGNTEVPATSVVPATSMTADLPVHAPASGRDRAGVADGRLDKSDPDADIRTGGRVRETI